MSPVGWGPDQFAARFSTELETYVDTLAALGIEVGEIRCSTRPVSDGSGQLIVGMLSVYGDGRFDVRAFQGVTAAQWWALLRTVEQVWWCVGADTSVLDHTPGWVRSNSGRYHLTEIGIDAR